jgi:hypothetical protein
MPTLACIAACCATTIELAEFFPLYAATAAWCVANFCQD